MLKGLSPLLSPLLLATLREMGHGDEIALVDANFPASARAKRLCRADGIDAVAMLNAILAVLPLDDFDSCAAWRMAVVDAPDEIPVVCECFREALDRAGYRGPLEPLERHAFYERAERAYAIVATGEERLYGNILLRKGVIRPEAGRA